MTSYVLIADEQALALYESALADLSGFFGKYQAFEFSESDKSLISGALDLKITEKTDYAYAKKIGAHAYAADAMEAVRFAQEAEPNA